MSYFLSPIGNSQISDANGDPLVGGTIETYLAGTSTPATTYTDITGGTPQGPVMTLDSLGKPTLGPVWMVGGVTLKFVIKNSLGVVQPPTFDNISGIGDSSITPDQFPFIAPTPTYISAISLSFAGDQTNDAQVNRRIRSTNTGGTIYSTITAAAFVAGITTVTVVNDSGVLDAGLSQVSYALLTPIAPSIPGDYYKKSNILGTVSQSAGIPTGAIIERGSNANGEYVRYADGTQICWAGFTASSRSVTTALGSMFTLAAPVARTFPSAFIAGSAPTVSPTLGANSVGRVFAIPISGSATAWTYDLMSPTSVTSTVSEGYIATGRWF
jgi:hypothetical protein